MIYLDTAGVGIIQSPAIEMMNNYNTIHQLRGKQGVKAIAMEVVPSLKKNISTLINCASEDIAYTGNTTEGINIIANGYPWKKGDRVLIPDNEYPANIYPWVNLKKIGVEVDFIPTSRGYIDLDILSTMISHKTKVLSLSHVSYLSGYKAPIENIGQICEEHNIDFVVDAAQSIGINKIDVQKAKVSALVSCGWKWLMGPIGSGLLYCSKKFIEKINPTCIGMDGLENPVFSEPKLPFQFYSDARKFEYSSLNIGAIVGLNEALKTINATSNREEKTSKNITQIKLILDELGFNYYLTDSVQNKTSSGILSARHPHIDTPTIHSHLLNNNIHTALWHGYIRFSPSYLITPEDINTFQITINQNFKNYGKSQKETRHI